MRRKTNEIVITPSFWSLSLWFSCPQEKRSHVYELVLRISTWWHCWCSFSVKESLFVISNIEPHRREEILPLDPEISQEWILISSALSLSFLLLSVLILIPCGSFQGLVVFIMKSVKVCKDLFQLTGPVSYPVCWPCPGWWWTLRSVCVRGQETCLGWGCSQCQMLGLWRGSGRSVWFHRRLWGWWHYTWGKNIH